MKRLIVLALFLSSQAFGWSCDEPKGFIEKNGVLKVSKECLDHVCHYSVTAPHTLEDRAFSGFELSKEIDGRPVITTTLSSNKEGANFYTKVVVNAGHEAALYVNAIYLNFALGCTITATAALDET